MNLLLRINSSPTEFSKINEANKNPATLQSRDFYYLNLADQDLFNTP